MLFHKSGPLYGQPRGYAFVTYESVDAANKALHKLSGHQVGCKTMVIRLAKNINYDELDRAGGRSRLEIPALTASSSSSASTHAAALAAASATSAATASAKKLSTQSTIQAIEAKLRSLEKNATELVINQPTALEPPLIHRYQYNTLQQQQQQQMDAMRGGGRGGRYHSTKSRYSQGPYGGRRGGGGGGAGGSRR